MADWEEDPTNVLNRFNNDTNKDDADSVKDDWEIDSDEEREKKSAADAAAAELAAKEQAERAANKKPSEATLAQKNRMRQERVAQLMKEEEAARAAQPKSVAELQAEKEEQLERQREADFEFTRDLLVSSRVAKLTLGTHSEPAKVTESELFEMRKQMLDLLAQYETNPHYDLFSHELIVALAARMQADRIKETAADLSALSQQKKKDEKETSKKYQKSTSVVGGKKKILSKVNDMLDDYGDDSHGIQYGNKDDDFM